MVVGEALSALAEKAEKQIKFKMDELESDEAMWLKSLTYVKDQIGSLDLFKSQKSFQASQKPLRSKELLRKPGPSQAGTKIISIEELSDSGPSERDDFIPYAKPDSDPEESDEDPTLVQRNKPTAPVYVRDLIAYLRDTENYDRQKLALMTAPSLIRRKANFGTEVVAHIEELATLLVGLQDKFSMENFQDMRLQGMIAVLLAQPS